MGGSKTSWTQPEMSFSCMDGLMKLREAKQSLRTSPGCDKKALLNPRGLEGVKCGGKQQWG